ncbi:hypothetical protein BB561_001746 [Smittium simulii]|uniref:UBA domain-containing protein n=1 Tax=Smittium simulii TaxID=133385 RepID=A0A2T9YTA4_9FUNG|nr:hypothetical protein BB561_001746 [Smittium simulii]
MSDPLKGDPLKFSTSNKSINSSDEAAWEPTAHEKAYYQILFQAADTTHTGRVFGQAAADFLRKSQLPEATLQTIWITVDSNNLGYLDLLAFYKVMKLISVAQNKLPITKKNLHAEIDLPNISGFSAPPDLSKSASFDPITQTEFDQYKRLFHSNGAINNLLSYQSAASIFIKSQLGADIISKIWSLVNPSKSEFVKLDEFAICMYLIKRIMNKHFFTVPNAVPDSFIQQVNVMAFDNTLKNNTASVIQDIWEISNDEFLKFETQYLILDKKLSGFIAGDVAANFFLKSRLPEADLAAIWDLSDTKKIGKLTKGEFIAALALISRRLATAKIPDTLPPSIQKLISQTNAPSKKNTPLANNIIPPLSPNQSNLIFKSETSSISPLFDIQSKTMLSASKNIETTSIAHRRNVANTTLTEVENKLNQENSALDSIKSSLDSEYKLTLELESLLETKTIEVNRVKSLVQAERLKQTELLNKKSTFTAQIAILDKNLIEVKDLFNYNYSQNLQIDNMINEAKQNEIVLKTELDTEEARLLKVKNEFEIKNKEFYFLKENIQNTLMISASLKNEISEKQKEYLVLNGKKELLNKEQVSINMELEKYKSENTLLSETLLTLQESIDILNKDIESKTNQVNIQKKVNVDLIDHNEQAKKMMETLNSSLINHKNLSINAEAISRDTQVNYNSDDFIDSKLSHSPFETVDKNDIKTINISNETSKDIFNEANKIQTKNELSTDFYDKSALIEKPPHITQSRSAEILINTLPITKYDDELILSENTNSTIEIDPFEKILASSATKPIILPQDSETPLTSDHMPLEASSIENQLILECSSAKNDQLDGIPKHTNKDDTEILSPFESDKLDIVSNELIIVTPDSNLNTDKAFDEIFDVSDIKDSSKNFFSNTEDEMYTAQENLKINEKEVDVIILDKKEINSNVNKSNDSSTSNLNEALVTTVNGALESEITLESIKAKDTQEISSEKSDNIDVFLTRFPDIDSIGKVLDDTPMNQSFANLAISNTEKQQNFSVGSLSSVDISLTSPTTESNAAEDLKTKNFMSIFETNSETVSRSTSVNNRDEKGSLKTEPPIQIPVNPFAPKSITNEEKITMGVPMQSDVPFSTESQNNNDKNLKNVFDSLFDNLPVKNDTAILNNNTETQNNFKSPSESSNLGVSTVDIFNNDFANSKPKIQNSEVTNTFNSKEDANFTSENNFDAFMSIANSTGIMSYPENEKNRDIHPPAFSGTIHENTVKNDLLLYMDSTKIEEMTSSLPTIVDKGQSNISQNDLAEKSNINGSNLSKASSGFNEVSSLQSNKFSTKSISKARSFYNIEPKIANLHSNDKIPMTEPDKSIYKAAIYRNSTITSKSAEKQPKDRKSKFGILSFIKKSTNKNNRKTMMPSIRSNTVNPKSNQVGPLSSYQHRESNFSTYRSNAPLDTFLENAVVNNLDSNDEKLLKEKGWISNSEKVKMFSKLKNMGFESNKIVEALEVCDFNFSQAMEYLVTVDN